MEKINIAELLKDCPKGMELDCTMYEGVTLIHILDGNNYPIKIETPDGQISLNKYGCYSSNKHAKCVIFPKGKTTWEKFQRPFKDGDIVMSSLGNIHILKNSTTSYCYIHRLGILEKTETTCIQVKRLATEEEKQKLFAAIKASGYKWNAETKTLEKLVKPKFKAGEVIEKWGCRFTIVEVKDDYYLTKYGSKIPIDNQNDFSLVHNKFDITTLEPFDKVLVRDRDTQMWTLSLFSHYDGLAIYKYYCINGHNYSRCIPYNSNKELLGTINDCDDYYKTWK